MSAAWIVGVEQITCLGAGVDTLRATSHAGTDGWERFGRHGTLDASCSLDTTPLELEAGELRQMDGLARVSVACAARVMRRASLRPEELDPQRAGIIIGGAFGCTASNQAFLETLLRAGPRRASPIVFRNTVSNAAAGHLAISLGFTGPNSVLNSGMTAGLQALAYAFEEIGNGDCDVVLTGASDRASELMVSRFARHQERCGNGAVPLLDGACMLALLSERAGRTSGWRLMGYGMGLLPRESAETRFVELARRALARSGVASEHEVGLVNVHGEESAFWVRPTRSADLAEGCASALRLVTSRPYPENSGIPAMLALAALLVNVPEGAIPTLFSARRREVQSVERVPRHVLFASVGSDGACVLLVLRHAGAGVA